MWRVAWHTVPWGQRGRQSTGREPCLHTVCTSGGGLSARPVPRPPLLRNPPTPLAHKHKHTRCCGPHASTTHVRQVAFNPTMRWPIHTSNPVWQVVRWALPSSPIARIWVSDTLLARLCVVICVLRAVPDVRTGHVYVCPMWSGRQRQTCAMWVKANSPPAVSHGRARHGLILPVGAAHRMRTHTCTCTQPHAHARNCMHMRPTRHAHTAAHANNFTSTCTQVRLHVHHCITTACSQLHCTCMAHRATRRT